MRGCTIAKLCNVAGWCLGLTIGWAPVLAGGQTQIHPPSGTQGGPKVIAILADHYTGEQETAFNEVADKFVHIELLTDPDYLQHAQSLTVKTIFQPLTGGVESNYGFQAEVGVTNCSVSWDHGGTHTQDLVSAAAAPADPTGVPPYIVVIGNHDFPFGCAHANWVYVSAEAFNDKILPHELGHLFAGLHDEYAHESHLEEQPPDPPDYLNCAINETDPHWGPTFGPPEPHCALYGVGIFHPTMYCKMTRVMRDPFCGVCRSAMDGFFVPKLLNPESQNPEISNPTPGAPKPPTGLKISGAGFFAQPAQPTPQPPSQPSPQPPKPVLQSVRVLIEITSGTQQARVVRATETTAPVVEQYERRGDYVFEISEGSRVLGIGVVTGDPFATRGYQGGGPKHTTRAAPTGTVLVTIPAETRDTLRATNRNVEIWIYKLGSGLGGGPITPNRFAELKAKDRANRLFRVPPEVLRAALE